VSYNEIEWLVEPEAKFPSVTCERSDRDYNDVVQRVLKSGVPIGHEERRSD